MNPNDMKAAWQAQASQVRLTIDAELFAQEVRGNERQFATTILWRDVREVGVALVLAPIFIYLGVKWSLPWTWYLAVPGMIWIAAFMVWDRKRHRRKPPEADAPLRAVVESSLAQVEHQISLLRNFLWWYLLPLAVPSIAFVTHTFWKTMADVLKTGSPDPVAVTILAIVFGFTFAIVAGEFVFVYWLNKKAVRCVLEPRRKELETLLASLQDEPAADERDAVGKTNSSRQ